MPSLQLKGDHCPKQGSPNQDTYKPYNSLRQFCRSHTFWHMLSSVKSDTHFNICKGNYVPHNLYLPGSFEPARLPEIQEIFRFNKIFVLILLS